MDPEDPVPFARSSQPFATSSQLLDDLPPAAIDTIVEAVGPDSGSPLLSLELRLLGGALTEAPPDAGALASLDQAFLTLGVGMVMEPGMAWAINAHLDLVSNALEPWDSGVKYANLIEVPIDPRMLQQVKARYDRHDLFRQTTRSRARRPRGSTGKSTPARAQRRCSPPAMGRMKRTVRSAEETTVTVKVIRRLGGDVRLARPGPIEPQAAVSGYRLARRTGASVFTSETVEMDDKHSSGSPLSWLLLSTEALVSLSLALR
jgi:hypothetical protein